MTTPKRKPVKRPHSIKSLPNELLLDIFKHISPTDLIENISRVCRRWRNLAQDPTVWNQQCIQDSDIRDNLKILSLAPNLGAVSITTSNPDGVYNALSHGHKDVRLLRIQFTENYFSAAQICNLITHFPNITQLDIQIPTTAQDSSICHALKSLTKLSDLTIRGVMTDTQNFVEALVQCEELKKLDISECRIVLHDHHLAWLFGCNRQWHTLRLVTHFVTEEGYGALGPCPSLRDLGLVKCRNLSQMALEQLYSLPHLRALAIKENCVLSAVALTHFFNTDAMGQLVKVDLTVYRADDDVALTIATHCTQLMHLRIAMCLLTDMGVRDIILNAANLTHLDLEFNNIRGETLSLIPKNLSSLKYLNLHLCYNVHINLLQLAQTLPNFTIIDPTGFPITPATFGLDKIYPSEKVLLFTGMQDFCPKLSKIYSVILIQCDCDHTLYCLITGSLKRTRALKSKCMRFSPIFV